MSDEQPNSYLYVLLCVEGTMQTLAISATRAVIVLEFVAASGRLIFDLFSFIPERRPEEKN